MAHSPLKFQSLQCAVCGEWFDSLNDFKGHTADGEPCPGGTPG